MDLPQITCGAGYTARYTTVYSDISMSDDDDPQESWDHIMDVLNVSI